MRNILFWMFSRIEQKNREKDNWRKQIFKNVCITDQQILHPNLWRFRRENRETGGEGNDKRNQMRKKPKTKELKLEIQTAYEMPYMMNEEEKK